MVNRGAGARASKSRRRRRPDRPRSNPTRARRGARSAYVRHGTLGLFVAALVFGLYAGSLRGPFVFDDPIHISNNTWIRLTDLSWRGLVDAGLKSPIETRPVANVTFALNYYLGGYDVRGYRVANLLIHLTTGLLIYSFVKLTLGLASLRGAYPRAREIAAMTATLWLVHPLATQSVAYIVQRMNSLSTLFYMLAALLYAKARVATRLTRQRALFAACGVAGLLALGSKEVAATLPLVLFLYEWFFFRDLSMAWLKRTILVPACLVGAVVGVGFLLVAIEPSQQFLAGYARYDFTLWERLLTEFRVVVYYLSLIFFPHPARLCLDYDIAISHSLLDPATTLASMLALAALLFCSFSFARKHRLGSFCVLWFLGNLVIESSILPLALVYEHRTYLPSIGICLFAVSFAYRFLPLPAVRVALLAITVLFSFWTYERSAVWGDDLALWQDVVDRFPDNARGQFNLGTVHSKRKDYAAAEEAYSQTIRLDPKHKKATNNRGNARRAMGDHRGAKGDFDRAIQIDPSYGDAYYNRGNANLSLGDYQAAAADFTKSIEINPRRYSAYNNRGNARLEMRDYTGAIADYTRTIELNPRHAKAHYNRGVVREARNDKEGACSDYARSAELGYDKGAVAVRSDCQ